MNRLNETFFLGGGGGAVKHILADGKKGKSKYIIKSVVSLDLCNAAHSQMNSHFCFSVSSVRVPSAVTYFSRRKQDI